MLTFNEHGVLPPGDYPLTFDELKQSILVTGPPNAEEIYWDSDWRLHLVNQAEILVKQLWAMGITEVFLDGSFVEEKPHPNDIDGYFICDVHFFKSGELQSQLNKLDPHKVWTWNPASRRPYPGSTKWQLPMWHKYRVELYPHYNQVSGIKDQHGNDLQFPAAFRITTYSYEPKGIIKIVNKECIT